MPDHDWQPIETAPRDDKTILSLKGLNHETEGLFDRHHDAWCGTNAPHFRLPFGPGFQPTHWKPR